MSQKTNFDAKISILADIQIAINHYQQAIDDCLTTNRFISADACTFIKRNYLGRGLCYFVENSIKINNPNLFLNIIERVMIKNRLNSDRYIYYCAEDFLFDETPEFISVCFIKRMDLLAEIQDYVICCSAEVFNGILNEVEGIKFDTNTNCVVDLS